MAIYSGPTCPFSHRVRMVLAEKDITLDIIDVDPDDPPVEVLENSPYLELPVLVDRGLVLYQSTLIMEYLDERFPHPPLMPVDPMSRAQARSMIYRIDRDWYAALQLLMRGERKKATQEAAKVLRDGLTAVAPVFSQQEYVLGDALTLVDCVLAPLLWRLPLVGVTLPKAGQPVLDYGRRLFALPSFKTSLSVAEREMVAPA